MPEPVSILFLLPALPVGGAERQISALARGLDPVRFRSVVACQHALGPVADELRAAGVPVHLLSGGARFDPGFLPRTVALLRRERVRIVLSHGFSTGVTARVAAVLAGVPVRILAEHSTGERDMTPARHAVNRLLRPLGTAWVAVAHGQRAYLTDVKGVPPSRLHVIPNGIDAAPFANREGRARVRRDWGIPDDAPVAGILAVLRPEKDHKTFLLAARFVADALPAARFVIVGDGPLAPDVAREVHALDLESRVVLAGRRDDIPAVLAALDVSVLCSTDVETFPMAFLESMAAGLPLVGTRVGGLPEMIEDGRNGRLVRPRDPQGLSEAMREILADPARARRLGEASRRRVIEEFSLPNMISSYEDLFTRLLNRSSAAPSPPGPRAVS